jgi:microcystin-dependent protein
MRDALNTARTRRYAIGQILTGKHVRTADDVAAVNAFIAAASLTTFDAETFGLFDSPTFCGICSMDAGSPELDSGSEVAFTPDDVGKTVDVQGAGPAGATLRSTIATYINGGAVTLADNASSNVHETSNSAGGLAIWGNLLNLSISLPVQSTESGASESAAASGFVTTAQLNAAIAAAIAGVVPAPVGASMDWNNPSAIPAGWLEEDGSAIDRVTYSDLFAAIGTTFGIGDGSTTFNLPDSRGRASVGAGWSPPLSARAIGTTGGEENHTLTIAEMPAHDHTTMRRNLGSAGAGAGGSFPATDTSGSAGGDGAHNNMQPYIVKRKIIRYAL